MRLFLNDKEAWLIKMSLSCNRATFNDTKREMVDKIIERIELCEQLQRNENKSK